MRLITRGGHDWTKRFLWTAEAALKNRRKQFVIDGEAVILGLDGVSDFNFIPADRTAKFSFAHLTCSRSTATTFETSRFRCARRILSACYTAPPTASSSTRSKSKPSALNFSGPRAARVSKVWFLSTAIARTEADDRRTGSR